jgi:hypothetical protein
VILTNINALADETLKSQLSKEYQDLLDVKASHQFYPEKDAEIAEKKQAIANIDEEIATLEV